MTGFRILVTGVVIGAVGVVTAADSTSPYQGQEAREIKALSEQEVDDYLNGRGLGFARAAELNRFPGPQHVLDLAAELDLTGEQLRQTQAIFEAMQAEAIGLGRRLVETERELDRRFAAGSIDAESLEGLASEIGALQGRLRYAHLNAHLEQRALLTPEQIRRYDELRGYATGHDGGHANSH